LLPGTELGEKSAKDSFIHGLHCARTLSITSVMNDSRAGTARVWRTRLKGRPDTDERIPRFSGDGRWVAYVSDETGRPEVYVQPFPPTGAKWQVSITGGDEPVWRGDGRELYYIDPGGQLIAVRVDGDRGNFNPTPLGPLFRIGRSLGLSWQSRYDATRDGRASSSPSPSRCRHHYREPSC
jgi:hypothetical protein